MADLLEGLRLYGAQASEDEPDPRPAPEPDAIRGALGEGVDALAALLTGTLLEPDLEPLLWALAALPRAREAATPLTGPYVGVENRGRIFGAHWAPKIPASKIRTRVCGIFCHVVRAGKSFLQKSK